jgi:glutamyl-tRNA reductase
MGIVLIGTSHKTAPVEVRERLAFAESSLSDALRELVDREMISEGLIVSTCNRVELIAATPNGAHAPEIAVSRLYDFLSRFHQYDVSTLRKHLYDLAGQAAIKHVFRVTASLDSMVVGEPQITGQVKEAFQRAQESAAHSRSPSGSATKQESDRAPSRSVLSRSNWREKSSRN